MGHNHILPLIAKGVEISREDFLKAIIAHAVISNGYLTDPKNSTPIAVTQEELDNDLKRLPEFVDLIYQSLFVTYPKHTKDK